ncbi:unnamed protein product [Dicrocoelium dendriticum]|nr:unnamed protein product [Dicrocoelium dendriticum]
MLCRSVDVVFAVSFCFVYSSVAHTSAAKASLTYLYMSNLTEKSQPDKILSSITANVIATPYHFSKVDQHDSRMSSKLLHVLVEFNHHGAESGRKLEVVAEFDNDGTVSKLHLPLNEVINATDLNLIKGLISLFIIRTALEAGVETDSSGTCRVSYIALNYTGSNPDLAVFHKVKSRCQRTQHPLDVWSHSLVPITKLRGAERIHTRYLFNTAEGYIVRAVSYEEQTLFTLSGTDVNVVKLNSLQELKLVNSNWEPHILSGARNVDEIVTSILGAADRVVHLAPIYPVSDSENPCSMNNELHRNISSDISLTLLRSWIEGARDDLHTHQLGHMKSLHRAMQLMRMLRCLPNSPESVDLLTHASTLSPPAIDSRMMYRQSGSWRDQLVDVLIGCGTPTCLSVVLRRLEALTEAANFSKPDDIAATREEQLARAMLFGKLWPQLAHAERLTTSQFERMFNCCLAVTSTTNRIVCLMALANLWSTVLSEDGSVRELLIHSVEELLWGNFEGSERASIGEGQTLEAVNDKNSRIMAAITAAEALNAAELINSLLSLINFADVYPSVRAAAIRSVGKLLSKAKANNNQELKYNVKMDEVEAVLTQLLLEESEGNLVIDREIVHTLLILNPYPKSITRLFATLVEQNRWVLIRECRFLVKWLCESDALHPAVCVCFAGDGICDLGAAGGWSGLAADNTTTFYNSSSIRGELFNINDTLVVDYLLQLINGPSGELCYSKLSMHLLGPNGGGRLMEFAINTNGLEIFSQSLGLTDSSKEAPTTEGAWVNLELQYFNTNLPPWTVFQGGMTNMMKTLWSASSDPAPVLQFLRPFVDERQYSAFSAGWILSLDTLGLLSVDLSMAMKVSIFTRSGRSLVRIRLALVSEVYMHVVHEAESVSRSTQALIKGFGGDGELDFITQVRVSDLPDGVCMAMNRRNDFQSLFWEGVRSVSEFRPVPTGTLNYRDITEHSDYRITHSLNLPGVSFDLGDANTKRCVKMGGTFLW